MSSPSTQPLSSVGSTSPGRGGQARLRPAAPSGPAPRLWPWPVWVLVVAATLGAAVAIVAGTGMTPSYDPYGWLVWGHQVLFGHLDLNAAPSWKPLTFVFTLPYALFDGLAPKLWSVTANVGTLAMAVFAWRIAYRLCDDVRVGRWGVAAAVVGALFAAVAELGMQGLSHLDFIANSDPLNTALVLAAIDAHLCRRPRLAYAVLFGAGLGRPEVWPFIVLYGGWLAWRVPGARALVLAGWVLTLAIWFVPTGVWSKSILQAGNLDLNKSTAIQGNKILGVADRWVDLTDWPTQVAALLGVAIGVARRDRRVLVLTGAALLWVIVEIAFAYHGFSAVPRYVMESAAVMIVIAGVGVARLLAGLPGLAFSSTRRPARVLGPLVVVGILAVLVPFAHVREFRVREQLPAVRNFGVRVGHLTSAVHRAGGPRTILACGEVAARNQYQSQLAWAMGLNVSQVYFKPTLLLRVHRRMVLFTQVGLNGWRVAPYNVPASMAARCARTRVSN